MAKLTKTLLRTGVYSAPQGEFRADRARLRSLTAKLHRMKAAGIRVPVSWGHSPFAVPGSDEDRARQQFWFSNHNAGYLDDLKLTDDGRWLGRLDVPGCELDESGDLVHWVKLPDGRQVKGKVGEVSVGVRPWKDGTGKDWGEALVHVALTPLPVAHGTGGFTATLSLPAFDAAPGGGFTLSLAHMTRTLSAEAPVADETDDDLFEAEGEEPAKKEGAPEGGAEGGHFKDALAYLQKMGLTLPEDTTEDNFLERICVACHALENQQELDEGVDLDGDGEVGGGGDGEMEEVGGDGAGAVEEPRPVMMSLADTEDPVARGMVRRLERDHKAGLTKRIERCIKRSNSPKLTETLEAMRGRAEAYTLGYTLSAEGDAEPVPKRLDKELALVELCLSAPPLSGLLTSGTRRAKTAPRPGPEDERQATKRQEKVGEELAGMAGARTK